MAFFYSSYYGLARVSDMGPEVKNWMVTDLNPQVTALLIKSLTLHQHGGSTPIRYPGYNYATPATPISPSVTETSGTGGVLAPGTVVGVRLSYLNNLGLETEASPEIRYALSAAPSRAAVPSVAVPTTTPVPNALGGGTYVYVVTKGKGSGETQPSGIAQVDVPFDPAGTASYTVNLSFNPISSYTDGTTKLYIYRATGLTTDFQLIKTITNTSDTTYTDTGSVENADQSPPRTNTFGKDKVLTIDTTSLTHPADAVSLRVYVTQNPGVYGVNHLLNEVVLATPVYQQIFNYLGSESLSAYWPKEFSQLPDNPPKIQLASQATGAPILTTAQDFRGYLAKNFVFSNETTATPIEGNAYVDSSTHQFKIYLNGGYFTLATPNGTYVHPATENGGHNASNIVFGSQNLNTVASIIANSTAGQVRKQVCTFIAATPSNTNYVTTSSSAVPMPEMETFTQIVTPDFAGQWVEIKFTGGFYIDPKGATSATASMQMEINGSSTQGAPTFRSMTAAATPTHMPVDITYATPISSTLKVRMLWFTTTGELTSIGPRRQLTVKDIF